MMRNKKRTRSGSPARESHASHPHGSGFTRELLHEREAGRQNQSKRLRDLWESALDRIGARDMAV